LTQKAILSNQALFRVAEISARCRFYLRNEREVMKSQSDENKKKPQADACGSKNFLSVLA
jgi:hypothetical protein